MDHSDTNNDNVDFDLETDDGYNSREARVPSKTASINSGIEANTKTWVSMTLSQLSLHVDMYVLADKYDIVSLGDLASEKFEEVAKECSPFTSKFPLNFTSKFPVSHPFAPIIPLSIISRGPGDLSPT